MARKREKPSGDDGAGDWLNTYADMVTLLMCFFVLLYSMSSIDSEKWAVIVQAFNKDAIIEEGEPVSQIGTEDIDTSGDQLLTNEESFDNLYWQIKKFVQDNDMSSSIDVAKGDGFTFILFRNNIFFDGDSYILRDEGKEVLSFLADGISGVHSEIAEVRVLGHTTQASPDRPNNVEFDRILSSSRASTVTSFIQQNSTISPSKLVSMGYGHHHAISPIDTEEGRSKNRRVEILITQDEAVDITLDKVYEEIGYEYNKIDE